MRTREQIEAEIAGLESAAERAVQRGRDASFGDGAGGPPSGASYYAEARRLHAKADGLRWVLDVTLPSAIPPLTKYSRTEKP